MAKVRIKLASRKALERVAKSDALADRLEAFAAPVLNAAQGDPNEAYVASLRMRRFITDRVSIQIGANPTLGARVEAKRGTLARALGSAGL